MIRLTFLISTFGDRLLSVPTIFLDQNNLVDYLVVGQEVSVDIEKRFTRLIKDRDDVRCVYVAGKGLTKSRNIALRNVLDDTDIVYFLDDDIVLEPDCYSTIVDAFDKTGYDLVTFSVADLEGCNLIKDYKLNIFLHNLFSIMKVGSIEIAAKAEIFKGSETLYFPEHLGVGAEYPQCEEPVFLSRVIDAGYKAGFVPKVTVRHPLESSGKTITNKHSMMARGVAFREIYGVMSFPLSVAFYAKSFKKIGYNKLHAFIDLIRGNFITKPAL